MIVSWVQTKRALRKAYANRCNLNQLLLSMQKIDEAVVYDVMTLEENANMSGQMRFIAEAMLKGVPLEWYRRDIEYDSNGLQRYIKKISITSFHAEFNEKEFADIEYFAARIQRLIREVLEYKGKPWKAWEYFDWDEAMNFESQL